MKFPKSGSDTPRIIRSLTGLSLAVMAFGTLFSTYLQQDYTETISWPVEDGWCEYGTQGFGIHCFGDFYAPASVAADSNPWGNEQLRLAYTPLSLAYFRLLNSSIFLNLGSQVPLILNFLLTIIAFLTPGLYIWMNQSKFPGISGKWIGLISLTAAPSLMMIDRGNNSFLLYPTIFFFFLGLQRQNIKLASYSLVIMGIWKPQTLILSLGILIFLGLRPFLVTGIKFVVLFALSFLLYPVGILGNLTDWFQNSRGYQNYAPNPSPGNYSFVGFIGYINGFKNLAVERFGSFQDAFIPLTPNFVTLFCTFYALTIATLFTIARHSITKLQFMLHSSVFLVTTPGTTFGYYLALMLIPLLLITPNQLNNALQSLENKILWMLYLLLLVVAVPAWPLNWFNLRLDVGDAFTKLGVQWTIVHMLIGLLVLVSLSQLLILAAGRNKIKRIHEHH